MTLLPWRPGRLCAGLLALGLGASGTALSAQTADAPATVAATQGAPSQQSGTLPDAPQPPADAAADSPVRLPRNFQITFAARKTPVPGKIKYYLASTVSLRTFAEAMAVAGIPNLSSPPLEPIAPVHPTQSQSDAYDSELDAYSDAIHAWIRTNGATARYHGRRFEVGFAAAETRELFSNLVLPIALKQDPRYLPAPINSDLSGRMLNAAESIVLTSNDDGKIVPNYSKLGGTLIAGIVAKSFYANEFKAPELDSSHFLIRYVGYSLLGDFATNAAHELVRAAMEPDLDYYQLHGRATDDSYYPLSLGGKTVYWLRSTYALRNFVTAFLVASLPNIPNLPYHPLPNDPSTWNGWITYEQAHQNYGVQLLEFKRGAEEQLRYHDRRLIGGFSESETEMFLQNFAIPVVFGEDPRYVPLGVGHPTGERFGHALKGLVITHTDAGKKTLNLPVLGATIGAAFLAKEAYYPQLGVTRLEENKVLANTLVLNFGADAVYNIIGEFLRHKGY